MVNEQLNQDNNKKHEDPKIKFMLAEYNGIAKAISDHHTVILKMMNYFLIVAAVPISFVTIFIKTGDGNLDFNSLPSIVSLLFLVISLVGFVFTLILINLRMGQIRYARTVNLIRRFFIDYEFSDLDISLYLILPAIDTKPKFFEFLRVIFWQVVLIGILDGTYLMIFAKNMGLDNWVVCAIIGCIFILFHIFAYMIIAKKRENNYIKEKEKLGKYDGIV